MHIVLTAINMAIFTSQHIKLGDIWPVDYLTTMPNGETKIFRLKHRECKKSHTGIGLQFIEVDDTDTTIYHSRLEIEPTRYSLGVKYYDSINEHCTIDYNDTTLQLKADNSVLGCTDLTWEQRREIVRKLKR